MTPASESALVDMEAMAKRALAIYSSGGLKRGSSTGWRNVDELYTVAPDQWTVVTGIPGSGKSEWLDAMLMNLAEGGDWEFCMYSPENYPQETHLIKLAEKLVRKPFNDGPSPRMTREEFLDACEWITKRFYWIEPDLKTPEHLLAHAIHYRNPERKLGIVLDPWNTLEHHRGSMSETDYVSFILSEVTKLVRGLKAHLWLVVHPTKLPRNKDGTRPVPSPYDLSGSSHWYNKADNIVTVHRDQSDEMSQIVELHVQKVRFKHIGKVGLTELRYQRTTGRYFEAPHIIDPITGRPERYAETA
jgi:twinkle protein